MKQCMLEWMLFTNTKEGTFMRKQFMGIYAPYLEQYLAEKRQLGFKQKTKESILRSFDRFTIKRG